MGVRDDYLGQRLGARLAIYEETMVDGDGDPDAVEQMIAISEMYKNFALGGLPGFKEDFDAGYKSAKRDMRRDRGDYEHYYGPEESDVSSTGMG